MYLHDCIEQNETHADGGSTPEDKNQRDMVRDNDLYDELALRNEEQAEMDQDNDLDDESALSNAEQAESDQDNDLDDESTLKNAEQAEMAVQFQVLRGASQRTVDKHMIIEASSTILVIRIKTQIIGVAASEIQIVSALHAYPKKMESLL